MNCWALHVFLKAVFGSQQLSSERTQTNIPITDRKYRNQNVLCISLLNDLNKFELIDFILI
jgi:hypothetical protein